MINGIYHNNYTPVHVDGTAAQKDGYQLKEQSLIKVTSFGQAAAPHRENYTWVKSRSGLTYEFHVAGMIHPGAGTAIQIVPFESSTGNGDWPTLTYSISGSLDGVHWVSLPTAVQNVTVNNAPSTIHCLLFPFSVYRVAVAGLSNNGWFSVISN